MSITTEVAHHNYKDSEDTFVKESYGDVVKFVPANLKFDIAECFSYGSDKIQSLDVDLCVDYESFSFAPIITNHFCEPFKF